MRKYKMQTEKQLMELSCNKCGRKIPLKNGVPQEGVFQGQAVWGYFSEKTERFIPLIYVKPVMMNGFVLFRFLQRS